MLYYFLITIGSRVKHYYGFEIHFPTSLTYRQIHHMEKRNTNLGNGNMCRGGEMHIVFLSLGGKVREAVLEFDIALNFNGMEKVYGKLYTLFLEDINQSTFKGYWRQSNISIEDFLINFVRHVAKLKYFNVLLLKTCTCL